MKVALLIDDLAHGGAECVVRHLARGLVQRGHQAFVYCLKQAGPPEHELRAAGVVVRAAHSARHDPWLAWQLARWLHRDRVELAHAHSSAATVWSLAAAKPLGLPVVQTWHGPLLGAPSHYRLRARRLSPLLDRLTIVAETLRPQLPAGRLARTARHIPNGIDRPTPTPTAARSALEALCGGPLPGPVVLAVGTICPEKNTVGLLHAVALLRSEFPAVRLVCVGAQRDPAYDRQVERLRQSLGLAQNTVLAGPVANAWRFMAAADVFCLPSIMEAMPLAIVEAMSQSAPIVATAVGDVGQLGPGPAANGFALLRHEETALLVAPGQPPALAEALSRVLRDPAAARTRAQRARAEYLQRFTAAQMVRNYEELYADCLPRRARSLRRAAQPAHRTERPRVLMVGPGPEQIGGMASVIDALMSSSLPQTCQLFRAPTLASSVSSSSGHIRARALHTLSAPARHLRALWHLARTIRQARIDIVHIHTCSFTSFYRSLADLAVAKTLAARVCLHVHGGRFAEFCAGSRWLGRWLIRRGCEAADAVLVLSHQAEAALRPYFGTARMTVVPNGVASVPERPSSSTASGHTCRFLFLGALTAAKGLAELIEAAAQLRAAGVPFELTIAGPANAPGAEQWSRTAHARGLQPHVRFVGPVLADAKSKLLADADCLVLPSHHEELPIAVLEAAAAGLAVIATDVGALPELMAADTASLPAPNGRYLAPLVPPHDAAALTREMKRLARDPQLRRQIGQHLRERVQTAYSLDVAAARIADVYQRISPSPQPRDCCAARPDLAARLVRHLLYPLHERLRGRPTMRELRSLQRLARATPELVQTDAARRLRDLLAFAAAHLPYYREQFSRHGLNQEAVDPYAELNKLPVLTKPNVRAAAQRMTCPRVPGGLIARSSGGTTGDTLYFHVDRLRQAQDLAARLFMQSLFGVQPGERRVHLWGSPLEARGGRLTRWRDRLLNELLLDAFDLTPAKLDEYLKRIRQFQPRVLYGYPTAVTLLARHAAAHYGPRDFACLRLVVLTGEELTADQTAQIKSVFGAPVAGEYGNREVGLIAHDCPHGQMHVVSPHIHVEIMAGSRPTPLGHCGEIVCTTLNARGQPFIRYRVGDVGRLLPHPCPCGLPLPVLRLEGGKITGLLALPDGRLCHGAVSSYAVHGLPGLVAFKTHQRRLDWIEVFLVVNDHFRPESCGHIQARYRGLFGPHVQVDCRIVDEIPPDPSGKRRHVVSDVAPNYFNFEVVQAPVERLLV